jgi:pimeloyl-ACP methyl ester carboxylesterase
LSAKDLALSMIRRRALDHHCLAPGSNGWPRERLFAVDLPNPGARDDDTQPQFGRSPAAGNAEALAATGEPQVVLEGNSRGGNAIRHCVERLGGAA